MNCAIFYDEMREEKTLKMSFVVFEDMIERGSAPFKDDT
jgi:hypothetical protein